MFSYETFLHLVRICNDHISVYFIVSILSNMAPCSVLIQQPSNSWTFVQKSREVAVEMPLDVSLFAEDIALEADEERDKEDAPSNLQNIPADSADIRKDLKSKFLVEMPEDFYQFWEFAKSLHPKNPQG